MSSERLQPSPLADVEVRKDRDRFVLVFIRELAHTPEKVWQALTDPAELREWAPFDANRNLSKTGEAVLGMAGGETPEPMPAIVRHAEAPRLLEYTWGDDVLRWQLEPTATGTRLTLHHAISDRNWIPKVAAGWHVCLDVADRFLTGQPFGRIVGDRARQHGWEQLNDAYAARLGIDSSGFPSKAEQAARR